MRFASMGRATRPQLAVDSASCGSTTRVGLAKSSSPATKSCTEKSALKQIQDCNADDPQSRLRFVVEAKVTGGLERPGIVPVYGLGYYADGRPYYAMRFIKGESLRDAIKRFIGFRTARLRPRRGSLATRDLLGRFLDVCNAMAYAYGRGVLHRDLKPGNVMLGPYGETLVVDWGLAKVVGRSEIAHGVTEVTLRLSPGSDVAASEPGLLVGTLDYMSPEQARGAGDPPGPASDVYSLGATLYHLLTGQPAFSGRSKEEIRAQVIASELPPPPKINREEIRARVIAGEFPPPRKINANVGAALEAICLKAMALEPGDRYPSPRALADDLKHWLADEPVKAWREPLSIRMRHSMRRHRTLVASTVAVLVFGLAGLAVFATVLTGKNKELSRQRTRGEQRESLAIDAVKNFRDVVQANLDTNFRDPFQPNLDTNFRDPAQGNLNIRNPPELDSLRKTLLIAALKCFRTLRDQLQADGDTRPETLTKLGTASFDLAITMADVDNITEAPLIRRIDRHTRDLGSRPPHRPPVPAGFGRQPLQRRHPARRHGRTDGGDGFAPAGAGDPGAAGLRRLRRPPVPARPGR